jgi:hypothetical protein
MRVHSYTRFAAMAALFGALACAGNPAPDTDETAAARDTTTDTLTSDTLGGQAQNPPGYRGMETDTTIAPPTEQPSDTFIQNQGVGAPQDTSGYTGAERVDTTGQAAPQGQMDTTSFRTDTTGIDTTGAVGAERDTSMTGADTSWKAGGDTTGYDPSQQQPRDSVYR